MPDNFGQPSRDCFRRLRVIRGAYHITQTLQGGECLKPIGRPGRASEGLCPLFEEGVQRIGTGKENPGRTLDRPDPRFNQKIGFRKRNDNWRSRRRRRRWLQIVREASNSGRLVS